MFLFYSSLCRCALNLLLFWMCTVYTCTVCVYCTVCARVMALCRLVSGSVLCNVFHPHSGLLIGVQSEQSLRFPLMHSHSLISCRIWSWLLLCVFKWVCGLNFVLTICITQPAVFWEDAHFLTVYDTPSECLQNDLCFGAFISFYAVLTVFNVLLPGCTFIFCFRHFLSLALTETLN